MKAIITIFLAAHIALLSGCKQGPRYLEADFYKNLYTGEILDKADFEKYCSSLSSNYTDPAGGETNVNFIFYGLTSSGDSVIQSFKYDIRIGTEYIVRAESYEKIGMDISPQRFRTIDGDSIQIGGKQARPILINLWYLQCRGCIEEMPALNRLQEKYAGRVDFVAVTFEPEKEVLKFLKRKEFNFKHVTDAQSFIDQIMTIPYPENIFINKDGRIEFIEGGIGISEDLDNNIEHFGSILDALLEE